jgi:hypothetical protein
MSIRLSTNLEQSFYDGYRKQEYYTLLDRFVSCADCGGGARAALAGALGDDALLNPMEVCRLCLRASETYVLTSRRKGKSFAERTRDFGTLLLDSAEYGAFEAGCALEFQIGRDIWVRNIHDRAELFRDYFVDIGKFVQAAENAFRKIFFNFFGQCYSDGNSASSASTRCWRQLEPILMEVICGYVSDYTRLLAARKLSFSAPKWPEASLCLQEILCIQQKHEERKQVNKPAYWTPLEQRSVTVLGWSPPVALAAGKSKSHMTAAANNRRKTDAYEGFQHYLSDLVRDYSFIKDDSTELLERPSCVPERCICSDSTPAG